MTKIFFVFFSVSFVFISLSLGIFAGTYSQAQKENEEHFVPASKEYKNWEHSEDISFYPREGLFGYINGGAEIFLQYDFRHLALATYVRTSNRNQEEMTLEIYRMASALDAFGIFSNNRSGGEQTSQNIEALNWVSDSQINFVKDVYFVNLLGFECAPEELESFAVYVSNKIPGEEYDLTIFNKFPKEERLKGSEKYIRGPLAAAGESMLLAADLWGFTTGTRAYSVRYHPHNSRSILVEFKTRPTDLAIKVEALFREYLEEVETQGSEIRGKNAIGRFFIFQHGYNAQSAALVLGEESLSIARSRLAGSRE